MKAAWKAPGGLGGGLAGGHLRGREVAHSTQTEQAFMSQGSGQLHPAEKAEGSERATLVGPAELLLSPHAAEGQRPGQWNLES